MDLTKLSGEVGTWARRNFGPGTEMGYGSLLGVVEEVGELSHAHLKQLQGIRGTAEQHSDAARDAIGDIVIYLADYCYMRGFDFEQTVAETWAKVSQRDWKANKLNGEKG